MSSNGETLTLPSKPTNKLKALADKGFRYDPAFQTFWIQRPSNAYWERLKAFQNWSYENGWFNRLH
ncbi:hypothetical protein [Microcoleus sp. Z1_B5]|uniref:hypothetical protein n=1 Tax=Microcoleus sp. Z1_B5 TaxID=3055430 RepID=UPI002FD38075